MADKAAIFVYKYPVAFSPSILNMAAMLANHGFQVDIYMCRYVFAEVAVPHNAIRVIYCTDLPPINSVKPSDGPTAQSQSSPSISMRTRVVQGIRRRLQKPFRPLWQLVTYWNELKAFLAGVTSHSLGKGYSVLIGVEPEGLVAAARVAGRSRVPLLYLSLEVTTTQRWESWPNRLRWWLESRAMRRVGLTLVQSADRADLLFQGRPRQPVHMLPVSELGPVMAERTDYVQRRFGVPASARVALYVGAVSANNQLLELARAAQLWPADRVLVIHGFGGTQSYVDELRRLVDATPHIFLSMDQLSDDELTLLVASADVGIALYRGLTPNEQATILSSGKIAKYLKSSLPVILNSFPASVRFLQEAGFGLWVDAPEEVGQRLDEILDQYVLFRQQAAAVYEQHYRFEPYFAGVLQHIQRARS